MNKIDKTKNLRRLFNLCIYRPFVVIAPNPPLMPCFLFLLSFSFPCFSSAFFLSPSRSLCLLLSVGSGSGGGVVSLRPTVTVSVPLATSPHHPPPHTQETDVRHVRSTSRSCPSTGDCDGSTECNRDISYSRLRISGSSQPPKSDETHGGGGVGMGIGNHERQTYEIIKGGWGGGWGMNHRSRVRMRDGNEGQTDGIFDG